MNIKRENKARKIPIYMVELDAKVIVELLNGVECSNQSYSPLLNDCGSLIARLVQV